MPPLTKRTTNTRENTPLRRLAWLTVLSLLGILAWDFSGLDMTVMHAVASPQGFPWQHNWWLEHLLHDKARQVAGLFYVGVLAMVWLPLGRFKDLSRRQRLEVCMSVTLSLLLINVLKRLSLSSCPWDLAAFGGLNPYVSHWNWGLSDGGSGRCFPGGHASSAFAFLALSLPWRVSPSEQNQRLGARIFWGVLMLGVLFGTVQTLRGAHYPSHTLWTGFLCWSVAVVNHLGFAGRQGCNPHPTHAIHSAH